MRYAVVDIGSNTVRMNIYDIISAQENGGVPFKRILTECENLGLLNYVTGHIMSEEGIVKLVETLGAFRIITQNVGCNESFYFATASLRGIDNTADVVSVVLDKLGIELELISGENEALLSFSGLKITYGNTLGNGIMIDMGGGSTELLGFVDKLAVRCMCLPFGSLALYKKFVENILPQKSELKAMKNFVEKKTAEAYWLKNYGDTAYLVGGTARSAGKLYSLLFTGGNAEAASHFTLDNLKTLYDYLKNPNEEIIKLLVRTVPDRLHTVIPGICAYLLILLFAEIQNIIISPTGIREGYLYERIINTAR